MMRRITNETLYQKEKEDKAPLDQPNPYILKGNDRRHYLYATEGQLYNSDRLLEVGSIMVSVCVCQVRRCAGCRV